MPKKYCFRPLSGKVVRADGIFETADAEDGYTWGNFPIKYCDKSNIEIFSLKLINIYLKSKFYLV